MQTAKGEPAKSMTADEFSDIMRKDVRRFIQQAYDSNPAEFDYNIQNVRIFMDHGKFHTKAMKEGLLQSMGLSDDCVVQHAAGSHDLQKPIENAFGTLKTALRCQIISNPDAYLSDLSVKRLVQRVWQEKTTADSVRKAFAALPDVYSRIIAAKGGWGSHRD